MRTVLTKHRWTILTALALVAGGALAAWFWPSAGLGATAAVAAVYMLWRWRRGRRQLTPERVAAVAAEAAAHDTVAATPPRGARRHRRALDPGNAESLAQEMLAAGRCTLLLRPQIAESLSEALYAVSLQTLHDTMAFVPEGEIELDPTEDENQQPLPGTLVRVGAYFLDRHPVTNEQYYEFVAAGGYEQMSLWEESIWPAVLDFVDRSGQSGPRNWRDGCYPTGTERHPVVGVSWYEAAACARWLGKRLPTDAEWVKAGSWPVPLGDGTQSQRRYPWGDMMDRARANLWGSGVNGLVSIDAFAEGVSVGGVQQLIGNVWEWTRGNFLRPGTDLILPHPMKTIRGGAFDTYFDNQATCQFRSGENPLARRHNIGFRCAIAMRDLVLSRSAEREAADAALPPERKVAPAPSMEELPA